MRRFATSARRLGIAVAMLWALAGCGLRAPLPNLEPDVTLRSLRAIQLDPTKTADQKRADIRAFLGLANDANGNRIANFLLNLTIP